jgi:hypothetical protein
MNACELTLIVLTSPLGQDQVPKDHEQKGCRDEFVRDLDRHLLVKYGCGGSLSSYNIII